MDKVNLKNKKQENYLKQQIESGEFVSFMLFVGQKGTGKHKMVEDFAATVMCEDGNGPPCQECSGCKLMKSGSHPDYLKISAEGPIKIADIRNLQKALYLKPFKAGHKVAFIENAHMMTEESANAMLKVLEEPPENSIIILTAPEKKLLPETIVSRSQVVNFGTTGAVEDYSQEFIADIMEVLKKRPVYEKILLSQKYSKEKSLALDFLNALEGILRDVVLGKRQIEGYSSHLVISNLELIQKSREYLKNNLSGKFVLENLILNIG